MTAVRPSLKYVLAPALLLALLGWLCAMPRHAVDAASVSATRTSAGLMLAIPYHLPRAGAGTLQVELLDPEGQLLGRAESRLDGKQGDGIWNEELDPAKPLPFDDLVWERVRYRFTFHGETAPEVEETRAVSEILRRPVVRVLGQSAYIAGAPAAIRMVVTDSEGDALPGSSARIELLASGQKPHVLFEGRMDARGSAEAQLQFPAGLVGNCQLRFVAQTPLGEAESKQAVRLENKVSILLTTEKPIYQPGQTIHVRALALDRADHHASAGRMTFEVEDSRGNKVFKKITATDEYGIASAEFALADEVNLGAYHLRALTGDPSAPENTAEIALNVQRYVLPKFKVAVDFASRDGKPRGDYRPGEHVTGIVHANYFFGRPVDGSEITMKMLSADVAVTESASVTGKTDAEGEYHFDLKLPSYLAGRPPNGAAAPVLVEAVVKDSAGHSETRDEPVTVSESALLLTAIPEGGTLIAGLENRVFVLASYADGAPAFAQLQAQADGVAGPSVHTDKSGVAVVRFTPRNRLETLRLAADDGRGNRVTRDITLNTRGGDDQVLLRTDRAIYKTGERIAVDVFSTQTGGAAYVDVIKDGQTVLTRDLDVVNGRAGVTLTATPEMAGTLDLHVYRFGKDARAIGDHRMVFVQPADELHVDATADAAVYRPGQEAHIRFRVTDAHGAGVHAALGLQVVDEAVFALAERRPGFAKVFFYLEQELMKPRYEIHSLSMNEIVGAADNGGSEERDRDAQALFAASETVNSQTVDDVFGKDLPQAKELEYRQRYEAGFRDNVKNLSVSLSVALQRNGADATHGDVSQSFLAMAKAGRAETRDAWGSTLHIESQRWWNSGQTRFYRVTSAGPDRRFNTSDDMTAMIEAHTGTVIGSSNTGNGSLTVKTEHDRGPVNGFAELVGTVLDQSGAVIPGAKITLSSAMGKQRNAQANAHGEFSFAGLGAGRYDVRVAAQGFLSMSRSQIVLDERDRAIVACVLPVGAVSEAVTVEAATVEMLPVNGRAAGGMMMEAEAMAAPLPAAPLRQMMFKAERPQSQVAAAAASTGNAQGARETQHIRSYFPEALYINPEIITDSHGNAGITVPAADSITTWRMAMLASTKAGALGTGTGTLKVFQDFFVDLDLPVTLTQGDRVSIPVAIYNYTGGRGDVTLSLQPGSWYSLVDDRSEKSVGVNAGQVGGSQFTLQANHIGRFRLTLSAAINGASANGPVRRDIVVREIEVVPNGREQSLVFNGRLDAQGQAVAEKTLLFPANAIPEAGKLFVRLYPGPLSQVIEGMDSLLRMPYGCFEQTSSSTYPNVLALDYMKRTKKITPEVHARAEGFIANGYQRLLTFEVPGGGFSWFGQAPANKVLTAYGLMEFSDMSKVYDVDPKVIARTRDWLVAQQQPDGSWKPDSSFINEGATNRYNSDPVRITAYIAWSLENTGYRGPALDGAKEFVQAHMSSKSDAYTLAVVANFAVDYSRDRAFAGTAIQNLLDARTEGGEQAWWASAETGVYATGESAAVETTGLAVQALLKWKQSAEVARKALSYIAARKGPGGEWGTTQATIMALRALLLASSENGADVRGSVEVAVNGNTVQTLELTAGNNDLFHQFVFPVPALANKVQLRFQGSGGLAFQVVGRYFTPWDTGSGEEALAIGVTYDRTTLAQNDIVTATAIVRSNLGKTANMVMVDLGIPPGFELQSEDLQAMQEKTAQQETGKLEKFSLTATQAILYFNALAPHSTVNVRFRLRAKYPIRAKTFQSRVYEYYDPAVNAVAKPVQLEVSAR